MALPAIGDGEQVGDGNTSETLNIGRSGQTLQLGGASTTLIGFHGASPVDQAAFIATVTASTTLTSIATALNSVLAMLSEKGLMASS